MFHLYFEAIEFYVLKRERKRCDTLGTIVIRIKLNMWIGECESTFIAHNWVHNGLKFLLIGDMEYLLKRFSGLLSWPNILRRTLSLDGIGRFLWIHTRHRGKADYAGSR